MVTTAAEVAEPAPHVEQPVEQPITTNGDEPMSQPTDTETIPMPPPSEALRQSLVFQACPQDAILADAAALLGRLEYARVRVLPPPIRACIDELLDYVGGGADGR